MIHRILKGLAPLAALAGAALVTGCDNMNIHIGDGDGVPLAELDMSGAAPTELVLAGPDKVIVTEGEKLDILVTLVEAYEAKHFPMDLPDPVEAIKFEMERKGLTVKDLEPMIGKSNRVYEILNHKRSLTLKMIWKLHEGLGIPAESLIKPPQVRAS